MGIYALLLLNKEIQEELFFAIFSKTLLKKTITVEERKEIWINLAKFYLKRNPAEMAIKTYQGHKAFIPVNSLMIGRQDSPSLEIWDDISNKNHVFMSNSQANLEDNSAKDIKLNGSSSFNRTKTSEVDSKIFSKENVDDEKKDHIKTENIENIEEQDIAEQQNNEVLKDEEQASKKSNNSLKQTISKKTLSDIKSSKTKSLSQSQEPQTKNLTKTPSIQKSLNDETKPSDSKQESTEQETLEENRPPSSSNLDRKLTNVNKSYIDVQMIEQIRIDVIRTKQWKNSDYHELLKSLIIKFIIRYKNKLEYFQGFNYITSFLLDVFGNQEESLLILDYLKDVLLEDFFFDNLCPKLSLLHFQINHVIKHHYPLLHAKWKNHEILSEVLFSSFIISVFTSFVIKDQEFIQDFWDIILVEKWEGVIKILLYIIEIFYDDIIKMDGNDTMKFFSEMKSEPIILKKIKKISVKDFVNNLKFNSNFMQESKKLFLSIERKNID